MSTKDRNTFFLNYSAEELAFQVSERLKEHTKEQVNYILNKRKQDNEAPLKMEEACKELGISRPTLSKWIKSGELRYISMNPNNPKSMKYIDRKDLKNFLDNHKSKSVNQLKDLLNGE